MPDERFSIWISRLSDLSDGGEAFQPELYLFSQIQVLIIGLFVDFFFLPVYSRMSWMIIG